MVGRSSQMTTLGTNARVGESLVVFNDEKGRVRDAWRRCPSIVRACAARQCISRDGGRQSIISIFPIPFLTCA